MEAAEVGVNIRVNAIIDLSAATVITLRVKGPNDLSFRDLPMVLALPTNFAERETIAADFPDGGNYFIQLEAEFGPSNILLSPISLLHIGESISAGF